MIFVPCCYHPAMLEFARDQYLWLFSLVALFFIVFFFARRWKKARVTYGFIWERVAKRIRPPTWKRLLRLILTLLISGSMLSSAALYAAGLGPAKEEQPAPLLLFIIEDNSPSMRAETGAGTKTTRSTLARRAAIGARYHALLREAGIAQVVVRPDRDSVWAQYTVFVENRPAVQAALKAAEVPTAVHYPLALHRQLAYAAWGRVAACPHSERAAQRVMSLPMSADLSESDQDRVVASLARAVQGAA